MVRFIRHFLLALQFFTRIPVTGRLADWVGYSPAMLRASAAHFPGIGVLIGGAAASVFALLLLLLPDTPFTPLVAAALSTVATVWLTGGFHEDGLADVADGLGGSYDRDRALEIMKDSRVGAFGAMALVLALLCKVALLALLGSVEVIADAGDAPVFSGWYVCAALWLGHVVSRTLPLIMIRLLPHVGDSATSKSKPLADQISAGGLAVAFLWCFGALALASPLFDAINLAIACGLSVLALLGLLRFFRRRLQGFTGDCLGTVQQVCEIAFYLGLAISL
ncbi:MULTISPECIES: adenosylcobinamide-GDP ribazoletransferase [unclassified Polaromonas]|jgi:adenosylcobinamide-GDP ribazoletransferase|uniref:adenosylcobinamide-GDP ribazoletransferase n=1 Tax=unclassified Polaromonas TaxID=2638319 RepID=UPI0018C9E0B7|nr:MULTISPECIES: adenosylcobinamide-GDP ribazoletransferase [unclassified Polaromonas]MBG6071825.1 adenosylcobinamide-GDP ribazoletransferase [Polaromonas sp. CG_9.7]MBG6113826.1 adenosylcobinamide-GDP ribazoletransferase [Polaromonas sp. CG_9.2]MDH6183743.1 adenosylcobinamide-GDP ribazoletransferase [Polaromonas sp. CG_23.6]